MFPKCVHASYEYVGVCASVYFVFVCVCVCVCVQYSMALMCCITRIVGAKVSPFQCGCHGYLCVLLKRLGGGESKKKSTHLQEA